MGLRQKEEPKNVFHLCYKLLVVRTTRYKAYFSRDFIKYVSLFLILLNYSVVSLENFALVLVLKERGIR